MATSIKLSSKEIQNLFAQILVAQLVIATFAIVFIFLIPVGLIVLLAVMLGLGVITLPVHIILKHFGRRGFYARSGDTYSWTLRGAFDRT
jgi:hypothetical protein